MNNKKIKFSVLMSIYIDEDENCLNRSLDSIWKDQVLKPDEIVLVKDGPLSNDLNSCIDKWHKLLPNIIKIVSLKDNIGLGGALNYGLKECTCDYVARMDADDISTKDRFLLQHNFLSENSEIDVVGSNIIEFDPISKKKTGKRILPEGHNEIIKFAKYRNPINHPSVMYRRESVLSVGGYKHFHGLEDYYLWVRMLKNGKIFYNLQENLVEMSAGLNQSKRRGGFNYAKHEINFFLMLFKLDFINILDLFLNIIVRVPLRLLPNQFRNLFYLTRQ